MSRFSIISVFSTDLLSLLLVFLCTLCLAVDTVIAAKLKVVAKQGLEDNPLDYSGFYRLELAFRYLEPRTFTKIRHTFLLNSNYKLDSSMKLHARAWGYYDLAYDLFDYETIAARFEREFRDPLVFVERLPNEKDSPVAEFRELYLDVTGKYFDIRVGLQQIVWGVLEGVRVVDELNPMDFRELILPDDLLDYRIPLWSLKLDHFNTAGDFQVVLIPDIKFHKAAPPGSEWELFQNVPTTIEPAADKWTNWEFGLRWSKSIQRTDLSLSYFYTWDDFPAIFRQSANIGNPTPTLFPTYTRLAIFGSTFRRPVGNTILKGELAFVSGKFFGTAEVDENGDFFLDNNGEFLRDHIRWGVGVDFNISGWDIAPTYVQWDILNYNEAIMQPAQDRSFDLYVRKKFQRAHSTFTMLWIHLIDLRESYLRPRVIFRITDKYSMAVGLDVFSGSQNSLGVGTRSAGGGGRLVVPATLGQRTQFFGNFNNNDRLTVEMRYAF